MAVTAASCLAHISDKHIGNFVIAAKKCFGAAGRIKNHRFKSQTHLASKPLGSKPLFL